MRTVRRARRKTARLGRAVARRLRTLARNLILLLARTLAALDRRPPPGAGSGTGTGAGGADRTRVVIFLQHAYGMGGTIRTVLNLAGYLAQRHEVEIVSVVRTREEPFFAFPDGVTVTPLDDRTEGAAAPRGLAGRVARWAGGKCSVLVPREDASFGSCTLWTDLLLLRALRRARSCVVIGTRPSLNLLIARGAAPEVVTIGQDHMNLPSYRPYLRRLIPRAYRRLDALAVLTEVSLADFRAVLPPDRPLVRRIPNALPEIDGGPADLDSKVIVTAGRLGRQKGYDLLIEAFAEIAPDHPGWTVRVFGAGKHHARLQRMIDARGLGDRISLMGRSAALGTELSKGSIYALSSRFEGLPMVIIEAMSKGLPVVAFDCPTGPAEMITDGRDGLLVEAEDTGAFAKALARLMEDDATRHRLGRAATDSAKAYSIEVVGPQWDALLAELLGAPATRGTAAG